MEFGSCVSIKFYQKLTVIYSTSGLSTVSLTSVGFIPKFSLRFIDSASVQLGTYALFLESFFILLCLVES